MIDLRAFIGDPGTGETNVRVLLASIVGKMRKAHGVQTAHRLVRGQPKLIASNKSQARQAAYFCVSVRAGGTGGAGQAQVLFDSGQRMGAGTNVPCLLTETMGSDLTAFEGVLLPNDQLYIQLVDPALPELDVIVTQVFV